jgi:hypothetical protein
LAARLEDQNAPDRERKANTDRLETVTALIEYIGADRLDPRINMGIIANENRRQKREADSQARTMAVRDQKASHQEAEAVRRAIEGESAEVLEDRELIKQVVDQAGVIIHTSLPTEEHPKGTGGFVDRVAERKTKLSNRVAGEPRSIIGTLSSILSSRGDVKADRFLADRGITEMLYLKPRTESVMEEREEEKREGIFGQRKTVVKKMVRVGERPALMKEVVDGGNDEPAYSLYFTTATNNVGSDQPKFDYRDYSGRSGQVFSAEIILPKKLAEQVVDRARQDRQFIHNLIDRLATDNVGISQKNWESAVDVQGRPAPLRPHFEEWDQSVESTGGLPKSYIVKHEEIAEAYSQGTVMFDERFVCEYKNGERKS